MPLAPPRQQSVQQFGTPRCSQRSRAVKSGSMSAVHGWGVRTASSGSRPTIERTRSRSGSRRAAPDVVEEAVLLVPQETSSSRTGASPARSAGSARGTSSPPRPMPGAARELDRIVSILRQKNAIQLVASDSSSRAVWQRRRPVEEPDVVHPEEPALEELRAVGVLAVDPPAEVQQELGEHPNQEVPVAQAVDDVDLPGRPCMDRRVHVAEGPFVRGQLAMGCIAHSRQSSSSCSSPRPGRHARARRSERPNPRRRTTGTPSRRAWR